MPGLRPEEEQIIKGMYLCKPGAEGDKRVQLLGSGTILREAWPRRNCWKTTGACRRRLELPELQRTGPRRPGRRRWNLLHPTERRACRS
jgi:pyruvate dehydrogenase E1 component